MGGCLQEASEVEEIASEGKQSDTRRKKRLTYKEHITPGTAFTSPWIEFAMPMDTNRYPDTTFVNTFTRSSSPVLHANKNSHLNSLSTFWFTEYIPDTWLMPPPARPSQSSTSRPNTGDTASTSVDSDQSHLSAQEAEDTPFGSTAFGTSASASFSESSLDSVQQAPVPQMDGSTEVPDSSAASQSELQTARLSTRDPFFDSVPKGPSKLSILRCARFSAFNPVDSTCDQVPASPRNNTESSLGPGKHP